VPLTHPRPVPSRTSTYTETRLAHSLTRPLLVDVMPAFHVPSPRLPTFFCSHVFFCSAVLANDDSRPVTANNNGGHWTQVGQAGQIDVQGFSHVSASAIAGFQKLFPTVPTVLSECCSCDSQRLATAANPFDSSLAQDRRIATCQPQQVMWRWGAKEGRGAGG
jgi:hypothetical protein